MFDRLPLAIVGVIFAAFLVYRFRPVLGRARGGASTRAALRSAKDRLAKAKTDADRASALVEAGRAAAAAGNVNAAMGYFLRATRLAPASIDVLDAAAAALRHAPHALEALLWRRLGARPWTGDELVVAKAALRHLALLYDKRPLRHVVRARALDHALVALGDPTTGAGVPPPSAPALPAADAADADTM